MDATPVDPYDLCSHDEWIHVFERLNTRRDRWITANAHPLFRSIFHTKFKREMVSALLFGDKSILVPFLNYLPLADVLNLRLLDKETKSLVDQCLEQGLVEALDPYHRLNLGLNDLVANENGQGFHIDMQIPRWIKLELSFRRIPNHQFVHFLPFLRQYSPQIFSLNMSENSAILPKPMPLLHALDLQLETPEQLASLQACEAPLVYLEVKIFLNSSIQPSQFFSALESFQNTLHTLRLITSGWHFGLIGQLHGDWPALQKFHLNGHFNGCSGNGFPFLDSFPCLSELVMFEDHNPHPISNVQDANVHDPSLAEDFNWHLLDQDNFYRSSIWTRFPDLQKVFFLLTRDQSGRYTRNTFQQRVAAGGGEPLEN